MPQTPTSRPNPDQKLWVARLLASTFLTQKQIDAEFAAGRPIVAAARGLFANSIGAPGDDINEYDDGIAILFPGGRVLTFNGNTQPTRYGYNAHAGDNMACLVPGAYWMVSRQHGASRPGGGYPTRRAKRPKE